VTGPVASGFGGFRGIIIGSLVAPMVVLFCSRQWIQTQQLQEMYLCGLALTGQGKRLPWMFETSCLWSPSLRIL